MTTENKDTFGTVPTQQCVVEDAGCPTLELWCDKGDASPLCGETPYVEETTVNAGVVAGITVTAAVVVIALIVTLLIRRSKRKLAEQKERLKDEFAKRIVGTFNIGKSGEALTMEGITEEFKLLDSGKTDGGDGLISKTVGAELLYFCDVWIYACSMHPLMIACAHTFELLVELSFDRNSKTSSWLGRPAK